MANVERATRSPTASLLSVILSLAGDLVVQPMGGVGIHVLIVRALVVRISELEPYIITLYFCEQSINNKSLSVCVKTIYYTVYCIIQ